MAASSGYGHFSDLAFVPVDVRLEG